MASSISFRRTAFFASRVSRCDRRRFAIRSFPAPASDSPLRCADVRARGA
jgi:hypothetical protein